MVWLWFWFYSECTSVRIKSKRGKVSWKLGISTCATNSHCALLSKLLSSERKKKSVRHTTQGQGPFQCPYYTRTLHTFSGCMQTYHIKTLVALFPTGFRMIKVTSNHMVRSISRKSQPHKKVTSNPMIFLRIFFSLVCVHFLLTSVQKTFLLVSSLWKRILKYFIWHTRRSHH